MAVGVATGLSPNRPNGFRRPDSNQALWQSGAHLIRSPSPRGCPPSIRSLRPASRISSLMRTDVGHVACNGIASWHIAEPGSPRARPLPSRSICSAVGVKRRKSALSSGRRRRAEECQEAGCWRGQGRVLCWHEHPPEQMAIASESRRDCYAPQVAHNNIHRNSRKLLAIITYMCLGNDLHRRNHPPVVKTNSRLRTPSCGPRTPARANAAISIRRLA